jgi:hypothetical protein
MHQRAAVKHGANFGTAKREAQMSGVGLMDGVHGKSASLIGSFSEDFSVKFSHDKSGMGGS